ncbi:MAG: maleylpyruvate isomerase N-terminal domain-containing protein [Chloroflexota bacterium]|nr:maleylpyruvate isomerase N-terminal domain-containing protein [Chloroflexota bacterium]
MSDFPDRGQMSAAINSARRELMRTLLFLTEQETTEITLHQDWNVRDVFSHITARECTALVAVRHLVEDGDPCFRDPVDEIEFNRSAVRRRQDFPADSVLDELDGIRRQLLGYLEELPDADLYRTFPIGRTSQEQSVAVVLQSLGSHDLEHAEGLWHWRLDHDLLRRDDFRESIIIARTDLLDSLGGLTEEIMLGETVCGHWTTRDVMAHVLSWDELMLHSAEHWQGGRSGQRQVRYDDEWNEAEVEKRSNLDVIALADGLATSLRKMVMLFNAVDDSDLILMAPAPWGDQMALISFFHEWAVHDDVHKPDLRQLQEASGIA